MCPKSTLDADIMDGMNRIYRMTQTNIQILSEIASVFACSRRVSTMEGGSFVIGMGLFFSLGAILFAHNVHKTICHINLNFFEVWCLFRFFSD